MGSAVARDVEEVPVDAGIVGEFGMESSGQEIPLPDRYGAAILQ